MVYTWKCLLLHLYYLKRHKLLDVTVTSVFQTSDLRNKKHRLSIRLCIKTVIHSRVGNSLPATTEIKKVLC